MMFGTKESLGISEIPSGRERFDKIIKKNVDGKLLYHDNIKFVFRTSRTHKKDDKKYDIYDCSIRKRNGKLMCNSKIKYRRNDGLYSITGSHHPKCENITPFMSDPTISLPGIGSLLLDIPNDQTNINLYQKLVVHETITKEANECIIKYNEILSKLNEKKVEIEIYKNILAGIKRKLGFHYNNDIQEITINKKQKL